MRSLLLEYMSPSPSDRIPTPIRLLREDVKAFTNDMRKLHKELNEELT